MLLCAVVLALSGASSCGVGTTAGKLSIIGRASSNTINGLGQLTVVSTCQPNEQLVGGGFILHQPTDITSALLVMASFPSAPNAWSVIVDNLKDLQGQDVNEGAFVSALAYCAAAALPLGMSIVSQTFTQDVQSYVEIHVVCPANTTVTGGGFQTDIVESSNFAASDTIATSAPALDQSSHAVGWLIGEESLLVKQTNTHTTVYALCASQNLTERSPGMTQMLSNDGTDDVTAPCGANQVATDGGYLSPLTNGSVYSSVARPDLSGWEMKDYGEILPGSQVTAWAVCVRGPA